MYNLETLCVAHPGTSTTKMDQLIPVINRLQDVFNAIGYDPIDLPQIVVVGSQSSGKSSVLENIVLKDFLPRGNGIVTRRPLVLQLVNEKSSNEWAEFLHLPDKQFTDFSKVKGEIEKDTFKIAGRNNGISKIPINLRVHSSRVLNLTLVDLPGLTKIPTGDQPDDIEKQVYDLISEYISKPNSIILAVSPANVDLVNSEALKIARQFDPDGHRTIGVLTKLDLMDKGTDAFDVLSNRGPFRLKLGYVGVINRSQQDIIKEKSIIDAVKSESSFFRNHPTYRKIANQCGTQYLARTLNLILMHHIRERLPELKTRLNNLILQNQNELLSYGDPSTQETTHKGSMLLRMITKFSSSFNASIDGTSRTLTGTSELSGGARLNEIFNEQFIRSLTALDESSSLSLMDVKEAIRNSAGPRPSLFVPETSFDILVRKQIARLEAPGLRCVELVFEELLKILHSCDRKELIRFPKLSEKILEVSSELVRDRISCTNQMVEHLVQIELAYINTSHPDFMRAGSAISALGRMFDKRRRNSSQARPEKTSTDDSIPEEIKSDGGLLNYLFKGNNSNFGNPHKSSPIRAMAPKKTIYDAEFFEHSLSHLGIDSKSPDEPLFSSEKEEMETHLILSLIQSYYNVVRKNLQDTIPKSIMHFLVNYTKENIQNRLVSELYKEDMFNELMEEDEQIAKDRLKCKTALDALRKASSALSEIRDTTFLK